VASTVGVTFLRVQSTATITQQAKFDYVVTIIMENQPLSSVYGSGCGTDCSYITSLAKNYSIAENYYSKWCLSSVNYLVLVGGNEFGYNLNCTNCVPMVDCPSNLWPIKNQTIIDRVEGSGRTWKAYMEDYPGSGTGTGYSSGGCYLGNNLSVGNYVVIHNPFVYFAGIENSTSRCSRIVPANNVTTKFGPETDNVLLRDLQSTSTASNYMWLTPNNCDNMHDTCYGSNAVAEGNQYLSQLVPRILNSTIFKTQRAALFITWDEGSGTNQELAAIWSGPVVKTHYCNCTIPLFYTHASVPKTLETIWTLPSLGQLDVTAPSMTEFFS
jgi:phospholipase C